VAADFFFFWALLQILNTHLLNSRPTHARGILFGSLRTNVRV